MQVHHDSWNIKLAMYNNMRSFVQHRHRWGPWGLVELQIHSNTEWEETTAHDRKTRNIVRQEHETRKNRSTRCINITTDVGNRKTTDEAEASLGNRDLRIFSVRVFIDEGDHAESHHIPIVRIYVNDASIQLCSSSSCPGSFLSVVVNVVCVTTRFRHERNVGYDLGEI